MRNFIQYSSGLVLALLTLMSLPTYAKDIKCEPQIKGEVGTRLIGSSITFDRTNLTRAQYDCIYLQEVEGTVPQITAKGSWDKFSVTEKDIEKLKKANSQWKLDIATASYICGAKYKAPDNTASIANAPIECQLISEASSPAAPLSSVEDLLTLKNVTRITVIDQTPLKIDLYMSKRSAAILCFKNKEPASCNAGEGTSHRLGSPVETVYVGNDLDQIILTDLTYERGDPRNIKCTIPMAAIKDTHDPYLNAYYSHRSCSVTSGPAKN